MVNDRANNPRDPVDPIKDGAVATIHRGARPDSRHTPAAHAFVLERLNRRRLQKKRFIVKARRDVA